MKRLWITILASLLMAVVVVPAQAQSGWAWCWNFTEESGSPEITGEIDGYSTGDWSTDGWVGTTETDLDRNWIRLSLPESTLITDVSFSWGAVSDYAAANWWIGDGDFGTPTSMTPGQVDASRIFSAAMSEIWIGIERSGFSLTPVANLLALQVAGIESAPSFVSGFDCYEPSEETQLTRPLQPTDRLFAIQSIQDNIAIVETLANEATIFGAKKDALVSAVIDGVVTQIEPLTPGLCATLFTPAVDPNVLDAAAAHDNCRVTLVGDVFGAGDYVHLFSPVNNPPPAFAIHILGDDGREYIQIATHVDEYVYEGQSVTAGCWLGRALSLPNSEGVAGTVGTIVGLFNGIAGAAIQIFGQNQQPFEALTAVWTLAGPVWTDSFEEFVLEPSDSAPCNTPEGYEGCLGDSQLLDPSQWQSSNSVSWTDPGALLARNGYISAVYNLDLERNPVAIIGGYAMPLGNLALQFGTASDPVNYVLGAAEVEIAAGDPDAGEFFTLRIENTGDEPVRLDFVCVVHENARGGGPAAPPPITGVTVCYFTDSSFEAGLDEWEPDGDVEETTGSLLMPDDAAIEQEIALKAGTYSISVVTQVWATGAYTPDEDDLTGGIEIEYAYPASSFVSLGTKTWAAYVHRTQTFKGTLELASDEDGTFTFKAGVVSPPSGALGVQINSVCLTKEGEIPAGEDDGLITPTCGSIPTPALSATAPGTWSTWMWAHLNKFFRCELIKVINAIYTNMVQFFRTALWSIRWNQAAVVRFGNFTYSGFYWLNGHLHNIAVGRVYVVEGGTGYDQAGDIGDVILGGLKSVIDVFIDLLQRVIDFVFYFLSLVFQVALAIVVALIQLAVILVGLIIGGLGQFFDVVNAVFFAWNNSTAEPIAGLPMCAAEPKESPVCIFLWTLENTIFSGRGFLFIPFMVAYGSAELLLWTIAKATKNIQEAGKAG